MPVLHADFDLQRDIYLTFMKILIPPVNSTLQGNLTKHAAIHSKLKPHPCPDCDEAFNRKRDLGRINLITNCP